MVNNNQKQFGFIGAGRMARALAGGFCRTGLVDASAIWASDPVDEARAEFAQKVHGAHVLECNADIVRQADVIVLSVKPQQIDSVMGSLRDSVTTAKLFLSIAAGVPLQRLTSGLSTERCIRIMPNTPCLVGHCAAAYAAAAGATHEDRALVHQLLESVGVAILLDEALLDAVTGLSGSGPAFVYQLILALKDGGVRMGLPDDASSQLAAQTVLGAAAMVIRTGRDPAELTRDVTSPGGTTLAGLRALDQGKMRESVMAAVEAATNRSIELGKGSN